MDGYAEVAKVGGDILKNANEWNGVPIAIVFSLIFFAVFAVIVWYLFKASERTDKIIAKNSESNYALRTAIENMAKTTERILSDVGDVDKKVNKSLSVLDKTLINVDKTLDWVEKSLQMHEKTQDMIREIKERK